MSLGLYLHIPYCFSKCRYCDFYSAPGQRGVPRAYVDALLRELSRFAPDAPLRPDTLYFGGGTPSLLAPADAARLIDAAQPLPGAEITLEANPETVTEGVPPGVPRRRRQPHLLRRPVGPGQPAQDAGPPPHRKAGPCGLCRRTPGRFREHQRRHHAGPAPLYAGRVRRDAGAYRGGRRDAHFGLPLKDRAGLCLWPDAPRGSAHLRRGGGLLPLRRRAAGAPRVSAVRDLELRPPRL